MFASATRSQALPPRTNTSRSVRVLLNHNAPLAGVPVGSASCAFTVATIGVEALLAVLLIVNPPVAAANNSN